MVLLKLSFPLASTYWTLYQGRSSCKFLSCNWPCCHQRLRMILGSGFSYWRPKHPKISLSKIKLTEDERVVCTYLPFLGDSRTRCSVRGNSSVSGYPLSRRTISRTSTRRSSRDWSPGHFFFHLSLPTSRITFVLPQSGGTRIGTIVPLLAPRRFPYGDGGYRRLKNNIRRNHF